MFGPAFRFGKNPQAIGWTLGMIALVLGSWWFFMLQDIQRLKREIVQLETKLKNGQQMWKNYPPLNPTEKRELERAQAKLFQILPRDKDIPPVLQEISRLAREHNLSDLTFQTGDKATAPAPGQAGPQAVPQVAPQVSPQAQPKPAEPSGPIAFTPLRATFAGSYRDIPFFLESLQGVPRAMTLQSLQLQRGFPRITAELVLRAYHRTDGSGGPK